MVGKWLPVNFLSGHCMLVQRDLGDKNFEGAEVCFNYHPQLPSTQQEAQAAAQAHANMLNSRDN